MRTAVNSYRTYSFYELLTEEVPRLEGRKLYLFALICPEIALNVINLQR